MDASLAGRVDALVQAWSSLGELLGELSDDEWHLPTGCPGWDVADQVAHVIAIERWSLGDPPPDHVLPSDLPHVKGDLAQAMELPVDFRRGRPPARLREELLEVTGRRLADLRARDLSPEQLVPAPFGGEVPYKAFLTIRVFDCYAHEQDVRRATGRPGNLAGPAAAIARRQIVTAWTRLSAGTPALAERGVRLELDGEAYELAPSAHGDPALLVRTSFSNALALGCGRSDGDLGAVEAVGDPALFEAFAARLSFTP
ncbi:MAG TPA: maleylpyruvate isomerase family mycothiol-dependent enzyme [Acidimicrobiales bacterium]|nr:maleylpyruvate isomerase family mycothiol-dependent enzyme [Acidimicrobiales bacterium]